MRPPSQNHLYGYNPKEYCVPQLQKVLNLENRPAEFAEATDKIKRLAKKYLDIHKNASERADAVKLIKKKLRKKDPALYDGDDSDKRLYFVEKYIDHRVYKDRQSAKRSMNKATARGSTPIDHSPCTTTTKPEPPAKSAPRDPATDPVPVAASPNIFGEASNRVRAHIEARDSSPTRIVQDSGSGISSNNMSIDANMEPENRPVFPPTPLSVARPRSKKGRFIPFILVPSITPGSKAFSNAESSSSQDSMKEVRNKMITDDEERRTQSRPEQEPSSSASVPSETGSSDPTSSLPSGSETAPASTPPSSSAAPMSMSTPTSSSFPSSSGPAPASASTAAANRPSANHTHTQESDIAFIRQFLLACKPPMDHFLSQFIDFGWKNKDFLYAMSTWCDEYRHQMLRRVVGNGGGEGDMAATEAEIAVLDYHLMRYGFQVENPNAD